ncbi:uncharacterized protein TNCV_140241 [Trichonephila clavipes]|uniref:Uncharacterized protein n=1 Tax=Trichonephila clavipes TaxID=2585209 RepID=A0A8X6REC5_TRICX|nr:uncharacterized protein TNCV_140241 [Trichonephila clavipes]
MDSSNRSRAFVTFGEFLCRVIRKKIDPRGDIYGYIRMLPTNVNSVDSPRSIQPNRNSLVVLNHKILEANSQVQNVKLGGHQTCLSINRLWNELCDMLRRLVGTTAPGHHDCSIQE